LGQIFDFVLVIVSRDLELGTNVLYEESTVSQSVPHGANCTFYLLSALLWCVSVVRWRRFAVKLLMSAFISGSERRPHRCVD